MLASLLDPDHAHPKNDGCDCQQQGALSLDGSRRREVVGELTSLGWCMPGAAHSEGRQPCGKPAASPFPHTTQEVWEQTSSGGRAGIGPRQRDRRSIQPRAFAFSAVLAGRKNSALCRRASMRLTPRANTEELEAVSIVQAHNRDEIPL